MVSKGRQASVSRVRVFFQDFVSTGSFPDGRVRLDVHLRDSHGGLYVWTPDWETGTRSFFLEAFRVERLNVPGGTEQQRFGDIARQVLEEQRQQAGINFRLAAIQLGESLKYSTTVNAVERAASALFDFESTRHDARGITSERAQAIYDWVMTLSAQSFSAGKKEGLLRDFAVALAPPEVVASLLKSLGFAG